MIFKKILTYTFIIVFSIMNANAMDDEALLVIGCRPWDKNMQAFSGSDKADFIDFLIEHTGAPSKLPENFHHIDVNDACLYGSDRFTDFAQSHSGYYDHVIIDWATFQHIRQDSAWSNCAKILKDNGILTVPVASIDFQGNSLSFQKADALIKTRQLASFFQKVEIVDASDHLHDRNYALLRRPGLEEIQLNELVNTMKGVIVKATK